VLGRAETLKSDLDADGVGGDHLAGSRASEEGRGPGNRLEQFAGARSWDCARPISSALAAPRHELVGR
jgi:hypothetical protein